MPALFRIKICGITSSGDARAATQAGADAIGLNFYAGSPRFVAPPLAREIAASTPATVAKVGVFVNATALEIRAVAEAVGLDYVQLHGDEPPEMLAELQAFSSIKAFRCRDSDGQPVFDWLAGAARLGVLPAAVLVDAHVPDQFGGTGARLDWAAVRTLQTSLQELPLLLAGGLTADNVAAAITAARPFGVDVASGVEVSPGKKDKRLVEQFVASAQQALTAR